MVEWLAAEYHMPLGVAIWEVPLTLPMVLLPIRNERMGGTNGPNYVDMASMDAKNKARAFLETHFEIVAKPVTETGWMLGGNTTLKIKWPESFHTHSH